MLSALSSRDVGMSEIEIEHLNYGKLTVGDNRRVPSSEGYGVTRRSRGLAQIPEGAFLPARLLDIKKFERELIDEAARKDGGLFLRTSAGFEKVAIMRARFRPEDGEDGTGRPYLQTSIWLVRSDHWAADAAGVLAEAANSLRAEPDLQSEPASDRLQAEPFKRDIDQQNLPESALSVAARKIICALLLPPVEEENDEDRKIFFGNGDFSSEAQFLAAVGEALAAVGPTFARWSEICIASGLHHECSGLLIRYLQSDPANRSADVPDHEVRRRIQRWAPKQGRRADLAAVRQPQPTKAPSKQIMWKAGSPAVALAQAPSSQTYSAPTSEPEAPSYHPSGHDRILAHQMLDATKGRFTEALFRYRDVQNSTTANGLLLAARELAAFDLGPQYDETLRLNENNLEIFRALRSLLRREFGRMHLGALVDVALLFSAPLKPADFSDYCEPTFKALGDRLCKLGVLLANECKSLNTLGAFTHFPATNLIDSSRALHSLLTTATQENKLIKPSPEQVRVLQAFAIRFPRLFELPFHLDEGDALPTGIHQKYIVTLEAVLTPGEYGDMAKRVMHAFVPQYIMGVAASRLD